MMSKWCALVAMAGTQRWVGVLLPLTLIATPAVVEAAYIGRFAVNVPFWDEWLFVPLLKAFRQNGDWLAPLWAALNEHRMVFPRIAFLALSNLSGWNVIVEMYFSLFLVWLSVLGVWLIYRKTCRGSLWGFVPVAWLMFSLGQYENILDIPSVL